LSPELVASKAKLLLELQRPLLADGCGADDQETPPALRPELAHHDAGLDGFSEADLVGQDHPLRQGRVECEESRLDLMRVEVHGCIEKRHG
jgi:hypothetical protein